MVLSLNSPFTEAQKEENSILALAGPHPQPFSQKGEGRKTKFPAQRHLARNQRAGQVRTASHGEAKVAQRTSFQDHAQLHTWVHPLSELAAWFDPAHKCPTR